jgi:hypothetical protein
MSCEYKQIWELGSTTGREKDAVQDESFSEASLPTLRSHFLCG